MRLLASRIGMALATVWLLATLIFLSLRILPGDPALLVLGDLASDEDKARLCQKLHCDESLPRQYVRFVVGVVTLDLGPSLRAPTVPAVDKAFAAARPTAALAGTAVGLGALGGLAAAVLATAPLFPRLRRKIHLGVIAVSAVPLIALAPVVTYVLSVRLRLLPLPGDPAAGPLGLLFAAGLLAVPLGAQVARTSRAAILSLGRAQFLTVARAKGAGALRVYVLHALPAVSAPIVTVIGSQLGALLGGAAVLERLFDRPGLGTVMVESFAARDVPVLEAAIVTAGVLFVAAQAASSAVLVAIDPRARE